jgi:hypothetical protein
MRTVVWLLLFANLTFFAFTWLDSGSAGETSQQLEADKIKLLTPQQVAALGPDKAAALPDICVDWGPFGDADRARALADLEPLALGRLLTQRRADSSTGAPKSGLTMLVVRDPTSQAIARLRELAPSYPSADIKVGPCDK